MPQPDDLAATGVESYIERHFPGLTISYIERWRETGEDLDLLPSKHARRQGVLRFIAEQAPTMDAYERALENDDRDGAARLLRELVRAKADQDGKRIARIRLRDCRRALDERGSLGSHLSLLIAQAKCRATERNYARLVTAHTVCGAPSAIVSRIGKHQPRRRGAGRPAGRPGGQRTSSTSSDDGSGEPGPGDLPPRPDRDYPTRRPLPARERPRSQRALRALVAILYRLARGVA